MLGYILTYYIIPNPSLTKSYNPSLHPSLCTLLYHATYRSVYRHLFIGLHIRLSAHLSRCISSSLLPSPLLSLHPVTTYTSNLWRAPYLSIYQFAYFSIDHSTNPSNKPSFHPFIYVHIFTVLTYFNLSFYASVCSFLYFYDFSSLIPCCLRLTYPPPIPPFKGIVQRILREVNPNPCGWGRL